MNIKKWRAKQVKEKLEELVSASDATDGVLWRMAEQRIAERQKRKPEYHALVQNEFLRLWDEAERALREKMKGCSPT